MSRDETGENGRRDASPDEHDRHGGRTTNRRRVLQAVGGLGVAGLASASGVAVAQEQEDDADVTMTKLQGDVANGMKLDTTPDGRVVYSTRGAAFDPEAIRGEARIEVVDPESGSAHTALELPVFTGHEAGGQGVALDPEFAENGWVYFYYSPPNEVVAEDEEELAYLDEAATNDDEITRPPEEVSAEPYNQLSRFTMSDGSIDPDSEVEIMRVHVQRDVCCHVGGDIGFDSDGNLYLSTGDDTSPFVTNGYAPIDETTRYYDAQRTAANTADLRGKILRITPHEDGSYTVPDDNLFTEARGCGTELEEGLAREEIYVMGNRNPFTIFVDEETDTLFWGDYGESAIEYSEERGSIGFSEYNRTTEAVNAGWPLFAGPNSPYIDYDYETETAGRVFDPEAPVNDSPFNTGLESLPPASPARLFYPTSWESYLDPPAYVPPMPGDGEIPFPSIDAQTGAPNTGPVYRRRETFSEAALPESYDGKQFVMDWAADWMKTVEYDDDGEVVAVRDFLPDEEFYGPQDLALGPDGALYLLTYGDGYGGGGGGGLYRIAHESGG